jgi:hypothetical protein
MSRCRITRKIKKRTQANSASGTCFFLVDDFGLECGPSYALTTDQSVPTDDPSVPEAIKTLSLASGWTLGRGPFLVKGQWLVPALAVRQRRVAQGNSASIPLR